MIRIFLLAALSLMMAFANGPSASAAGASKKRVAHHHHHIVHPAASPNGHAFAWEYPGRAPAFKTRDAAMAGREEVFTAAGFSPEDVKVLVEATSHPRTGRVMVVNTNLFDFMASRSQGRLVVHHDVEAAFKEPPKGVPAADGGLFLWADYWQVPLSGGRVAYLYLPDICFNWAGKVKIESPPPPPAAVDTCDYTLVALEAGDELHHDVAGPAPLPVSAACPLAYLMPGETQWRTDFHYDCTECNQEEEAREVGQPITGDAGQSFRVLRTGWYVLRHPRLPEGYFELVCDVRPDGYKAAQFLTWREFESHKAFVVYRRGQEATWSGHLIIWHWHYLPDGPG